MSTGNNDKADAVVALVSGAIIGVAVALFFMRMQGKRAIGSNTIDDEYLYDGGDLFI